MLGGPCLPAQWLASPQHPNSPCLLGEASQADRQLSPSERELEECAELLRPPGTTQQWPGAPSRGATCTSVGTEAQPGQRLRLFLHPTPHLCLNALLTMALNTRRSPTWDGPRKWNISMAFSVGWARQRRLREQER